MKKRNHILSRIFIISLTLVVLVTNIQVTALAGIQDSNIDTVSYDNGSKIVYTYNDNGKISNVDYYSAENVDTPLYNYQYTYNADEIDSVVCNVSNPVSGKTEKFKTVYKDKDFKLFDYVDKDGTDTERMLYESNNNTFSKTESFYFCFGNIENSGFDSAVTLYRSNKLRDTMSFSIEKTFLGYNPIEYSMTSIIEKDSLGRVKSNNIDSNFANQLYPDNIGEFNHNMEYSYLDLPNDKSASLVSEYSISGDMMENSYISETVALSTILKYDSRGNLKFKYFKWVENNEIYYLLGNFYAYDEHNHTICEADFLNNQYIDYSYDNNDNLYRKRIFGENSDLKISDNPDFDIENLLVMNEVDFEQFNFDIFSNSYLLIDNSRYYEYNYNFDPVFKDRLIEYTEKECEKNGNIIKDTIKVNEQINYDACGNPLNYIGHNYQGLIKANLKWCGDLLTEFDILDENGKTIKIFTYVYDYEGNRIAKKKYIRKENGSFDLHTEQNYIWENDVLQGVIFKGNPLDYLTENNDYNDKFVTYAKIIYDTSGSPIAYITSIGVMYQYIKDFQGNIVGLQSTVEDSRINKEESSVFVELHYDSLGKFDFYNPPKADSSKYNSYMLTALFNPCTYKNYLYDYESGIYFAQNTYYSPLWGKTISNN